MGTLRFFEEVVSFKIRRTFGFADYKNSRKSCQKSLVPNPNNSGSPFPRLSGSVQTAADILLLRKREINVNYTCIIVKYTLHLSCQ